MTEKVTVLAETEEFSAWQIQEPDGEVTYHLELGNATIHFFEEEWTQFLALARQIVAA